MVQTLKSWLAPVWWVLIPPEIRAQMDGKGLKPLSQEEKLLARAWEVENFPEAGN